MKITRLMVSDSGARTVEINCNEISFRGLVRCLHRLKGCVVENASLNPFNDNASAKVFFKNQVFNIYTPFSDYLISSDPCNVDVFEELVHHLEQYEVGFFERVF